MGILAVTMTRGLHAVPRFLGTLCPMALVLVGTLLTGLVLVAAVAWPSIASIAARRPPASGYRGVSELLKYATVLLTALSLPPLATAGLTAAGVATHQAQWQLYGDRVVLRMSPSLDEAAFQEAKSGIAALVAGEESSGEAAFVYVLPPEVMAGLAVPGFDAVVLTNDAYLDQILVANGLLLAPADPASAREVESFLAPERELWERTPGAVESATRQLTVPEGRALPALTGTGLAQLELIDRPLILSVPTLSGAYDDDFIGSVVSSGNVMFSDPASVLNQVSARGLDDLVLSVDRAADSGLLQGQSAGQQAANRVLAIALIMASLAVSSAVAASIHALTHARRHFALRTGGRSWSHILRARLMKETAVATLLAAGAGATLHALGQEYAWTAVAAVLLYLAVSVPVHLAAVRRAFDLAVDRSL